MTAAVPLSVTWDDIQSMPPGTRRDQLAYAYRNRARARRANSALTKQQIQVIQADSEYHRLAALLRWQDTPAEQARRRIIAACGT